MASVFSDAELVGASLHGDRSAFAELIERHQSRARAVVRRLLADPYDVEDVMQEAILQAYLGLADLREPDRFGSWLTGTAVNLAKMSLRRERRRVDGSGGRLVPDGSTEPTPEQALESAELLRLVQGALDVLPPGERMAVLMHYVDGLSCEEVASLLGRSTGAVRVRLHRARSRLREQLAPTIGKELGQMVEVEIEDVITRMLPPDDAESLPKLANERLRVVVLREKQGDRALPMWIGAPEGDSLAVQLAGDSMPRPLTADLTARLIEAAGAKIERVTVSSLREKTFYAVIAVSGAGGLQELDARPSDALNLAARVGAPIFVDDEVLREAGRPAQGLQARLDDDEAKYLGIAGEGEWRSMSTELIHSLWQVPKPAP